MKKIYLIFICLMQFSVGEDLLIYFDSSMKYDIPPNPFSQALSEGQNTKCPILIGIINKKAIVLQNNKKYFLRKGEMICDDKITHITNQYIMLENDNKVYPQKIITTQESNITENNFSDKMHQFKSTE